ncbi:uncharacterized protein LOC135716378, partial [Ochlerotatus camptorhynchus]|uniref:uncharacterized protein LOC135716378 n=1 Tax=Ochlerotatus camptorhynchus TaxID=644619 RepID=UPI0031D52803
MLSLLAWAYIRQYASHHHNYHPLLEQHSSRPLEQQDFLGIRAHFGTHHAATEQINQSHQYPYDDASAAGGRRVNLTSLHHIPLSAWQGVKRTVDVGGIGFVNLNHCCTNESRSSIMRFSDNSSNLLITEQSVIVEVSGSGTSGSHVSLVEQVRSGETDINDSVVGVVGRPSGVGGAEDVFSMNITPALSQVLLAPTSASGPGAVISVATATKVGTANDNVTSEEINSFYFYE